MPTESVGSEPDRCSREAGPRVAFFFGWLGAGGVSRTYTTLAPYLSESFEIDFIVLDGSRDAFSGFENFIANKVALIPNGGFRWYKPWMWWRATVGLAKQLHDRCYTAVIVSGHFETLLASWLCGRHGTAFIPQLHADWGSGVSQMRSRWSVTARRALAKMAFGRADKVIVVSQALADEMNSAFGVPLNKISVIPNPIDTDRFRTMSAQEGVPGDAWFDDRFFHFISVGRLTKAKNFRFLIDAFTEVAAVLPEVRLAIVGDGELRAELESRALAQGVSRSVRFLGFRNDIERLLCRAGAFVSSSSWEGFGNAIVEAMASGLPIIATRCSGPVDILGSDQEFGILTKPGNQEELVSAMLRVARDPALRSFYAGKARLRSDHYRAGEIAELYRTVILETCVAGGGRTVDPSRERDC